MSLDYIGSSKLNNDSKYIRFFLSISNYDLKKDFSGYIYNSKGLYLLSEIDDEDPNIDVFITDDLERIKKQNSHIGSTKIYYLVDNFSNKTLLDSVFHGVWDCILFPKNIKDLALIVENILTSRISNNCPILEKISKNSTCSKILIQRISEITTKDYGGDLNFDNPLSERDKEILSHISMGKSNKEIANQVGLAEQTIKNTISVILDKTFTSNRAQAVSMATKNNWI
ncbi:MAG: hypothetical protein CL774_01735 [Chloroflexi bacterium]|nr:hypothetical protein [Chloroflexota bacterium]|tara:strand:+ start:24905 stop:25585 length:681 start_codon:yes stop_codon:yes gene_type:complete